MFTGIITDIGKVTEVERKENLVLTIAHHYGSETIEVGESVACNGVCLTAVSVGKDFFTVDVSNETIARSAPNSWRKDAKINLERALRANDRLSGHFVTGHVDGFATLTLSQSSVLGFEVEASLDRYISKKGAVTLDGVSLTVNEVEQKGAKTAFFVNLIPHTAQHTILGEKRVGDVVNIEVDMIARYLEALNR